jgi:predicted outer membrane repeat protein
VSCPCFAGIIAITNQGRAINGLPALNSASPLSGTATNTALYSAPTGFYHDIMSGSNGGYSAGPGYDLVTGIGSPTGSLITFLAGGPAPTFTVTNTADSGTGSFRKAVADESAAGFGRIVFDKSVFSTAKTITLTTGPIVIGKPAIITGPGSGLLTITGGGSSRIFSIDAPGSGNSISISGMDLKLGGGGGGVGSGLGGAIYNEDEALSLSDVIVESSTATLSGGGIYVHSPAGSLTLTNCVVKNNKVLASPVMGTDSGDGGGIGIHAASSVTITGSTISGNTATGDGGGIEAFMGVTLSLSSSTLSGNKSTSGKGAGLSLSYVMGTLTNCTVSGNTAAAGNGGGIAAQAFSYLTLNNSTIAYNSTSSSGGGLFVAPAGVTPPGSATITSSIIADNTCSGSPEVSGSVSEYVSLIGDTTGATVTGTGNKNGVDPLLGPLTIANGGPTATHTLSAGSPAIDSGANPTGAANDQRGAGYPRGVNFTPDMGAVEYVPPVLTVFTPADSGPGTLREAITEANALLGTQTITFALPPGISIMLSGPITISDAVTITGPGASKLTIDGAGKRVFLIDDGNPTVSIPVTLSGMTIKDGGVMGDFGGAIRCNGESLTIANCVFTMNGAAGTGGAGVTAGGGAIAAFAGSLTITDSTFISNFSPMGYGGAIFGYPDTFTVQRSSFTGNSALGGGAIYVSGTTTIDSSLISGNSATSSSTLIGGGGLLFENYNFPFAFTVRNSTITANTASMLGGGTELLGSSLGLTVQNSTIAGNMSSGSSLGGGGIARTGAAAGTSAISLESTIVQGNFAPGSPNIDLYSLGTVTAKFCDIGSSTGVTTFTPDATTMSLIAIDPMLLPLMDNGGPTMTRALSPFSPIINMGSNPASLSADQRGTGFARVVGPAPDIGAYEVQPPPKVSSVVVNDGSAQRSRITSVTVNFDSIVFLPGTPESAFELKRQGDGAIVGLSAAVTTDTATHVTLTFTGGPVDYGSLADGRYTLKAFASSISDIYGFLDGNGDGTGGDDFILASAPVGMPPTNIFRFYGDINGDGTVSASDFIQFRQYFGGVNSALDFNNDGSVAASDFIQFRLRFGGSI